MSTSATTPVNDEHASLLVIAASLKASIEAREKQSTTSDDFRFVTENERARLREVEARIKTITAAVTPKS